MSLAKITIPGIRLCDSKQGTQAKPSTYVVEVRSKSAQDGDPIAYLLIHREERQRLDERNGSVFDANIRITYTELIPTELSWQTAQNGWFNAAYTKLGNEPVISLTATDPYSLAYVIVEIERIRGQRFGTYLMDEIVTWAKRWPEASVLPVHLLEGQAYEENKDRRNRFYERFGIEFDYADDNKKAGKSKPMLGVQLLNVNSWKENIRELDLHGYMTFVLTERRIQGREISELQRQLEWRRAYMDNVRAAPFRWAFEQRFPYFMEIVVKLILLSLLAYTVATAIR